MRGLISVAMVVVMVIIPYGVLTLLIVLLIKALRKYIKSEPVRSEKKNAQISLGQVLKEHRIRRGVTQEFVAEALNVSRQAVSKWENGTSDPSTANLIALARLYEIAPEELLKQIL